MQKQFVIAVFLGLASSMRLNAQINHDKKWVELPNCNTRGDASGNFTNPAEVPLQNDLSNAAIATCKGDLPVAAPAAANDTSSGEESKDSGAAAWEAKTPSTIYDPVHKTSTAIPDHQHQVDQRSHNSTTQNRADDRPGPKGDFANTWNYPYQKAPNQWDDAGPMGKNFTGNRPAENSVGVKPPPAAIPAAGAGATNSTGTTAPPTEA